MSGPLAGYRVLDLTAVLTGPLATQMMADMGADVIKVEAPKGDVLRWNGPSRTPGMGPIFLHMGRGKRSIVLDLKKPRALQLLLKIAAKVDVLVCNNRPESMARLKLAYADVAKVNPKIVYCNIFGFSEGGPYSGKPAYDDLVQGLAALPALTAAHGAEPRYFPMAIADKLTGVVASHAILAALLHRERTGEGQSLEIPMFETLVEFNLSTHLYGEAFVPAKGAMGYQRHLVAERRPYVASDGRHLGVMPYTDKHWESFFGMIGRPELLSDPRFATFSARISNTRALYQVLAEALATRPQAEWLALFAKADIPAMPTNTLETLLADPHLEKTGFFQVKDHPTEGKIRTMAVPGRWSKSQPSVTRQAPTLGQHTREVLEEIGISDAEMQDLLKEGVVAEGPAKDAAK